MFDKFMNGFICKSWVGMLTLSIGLVIAPPINNLNDHNAQPVRIVRDNYTVKQLHDSKAEISLSLCDLALNPKRYNHQFIQFRADQLVGFLSVIKGSGSFTIQSKCETGRIITAYVGMKDKQAFDRIVFSREINFSPSQLEATVAGQVESRLGEYGDRVRFHITATDVKIHVKGQTVAP